MAPRCEDLHPLRGHVRDPAPGHLPRERRDGLTEAPRAEGPLRKVDCVQLSVPDLDEGLAFYRDRLGHDLIWRTETAAGLRLPESETELVLRTQRPQPEVDFLANSADEAAVRLVQAGGTLLVEPFDIPVGRVAVVADPFGDGGLIPALVAALRLAPAPLAPISLVATLGDRVVGHVLLSGCRLDAPHRIVDVLSLSPLGVLPAHQRQGIGTRLIQHALAAADDQGVPLVFLEGSPDFYGRRGFERAGAAGFRSPSLRIPDAVFQVARLSAYEPWMMGTFVYSEPFWALDCVGLREPGT